jgi:hypothetical protein
LTLPSERGLSVALREFIASRIHTVVDLDVMLLLRSSADRWWSDEEVARQLLVAPTVALNALERLAGGFLEVRVTSAVHFRFAPTHPERIQLAADLAAAAAADRDAVLRVVAQRPGRAMREFAEAFRLRGRK